MNLVGEVGLSVLSENGFEDNIEKIICISPTKIIKKGQTVGGISQAPQYVWLYHEKFFDDVDLVEKLKGLLHQLLKKSEAIQMLNKKYDTRINIYLRSEQGQLGYIIPKEIFKMAAELELDMHFHILSLGMVDIDNDDIV